MAAKRPLRTVQVLAIILSFCTVIASWVVFERPYGTIGTIAASIAPCIGSFVALGIVLAAPAFRRKPFRSSNYPRIEHLRIAGRYHPVRRFSADMGISPLHVRG